MTTEASDVTISRLHFTLLLGLARRQAHTLRDRYLAEKAKATLSGNVTPQDAKILRIREAARDSAFDILQAAENLAELRWDVEKGDYVPAPRSVV